MSELDLKGKSALIVGGSSGIGNAIAQTYRMKGAEVHVWGTRPEPEDYAEQEGSDLTGLHYQQMDVGDAGAIERYRPPFDRLDILVLAQGIVLYQRGEFAVEGFRKVLDVNLVSLMACASKFFPRLKESRGCLIIISSTAAFRATRGNPGYNASKSGALGLTRTLGDAWAADGVRVNGIAPGFVETKLIEVTTKNPRRREAAVQRIPLGRIGAPSEIAGVALFLASPLASYIVGQTIAVDGGLILS